MRSSPRLVRTRFRTCSGPNRARAASGNGAYLPSIAALGVADRHEQRTSAEQCTLRGMSEEYKIRVAAPFGQQRAEHHPATGGAKEGARRPWWRKALGG